MRSCRGHAASLAAHLVASAGCAQVCFPRPLTDLTVRMQGCAWLWSSSAHGPVRSIRWHHCTFDRHADRSVTDSVLCCLRFCVRSRLWPSQQPLSLLCSPSVLCECRGGRWSPLAPGWPSQLTWTWTGAALLSALRHPPGCSPH